MDEKLLKHYQGAPRDPVFMTNTPSAQTSKPVWPLLVYGFLISFMVVGAALTFVS